MKAHFTNPRDPFSIIGFLATLKLACDTKRIHEGAAKLFLRFVVKKVLATTLNSFISTVKYVASVVASINNV